MGKSDSYGDEFPLLAPNGLYAATIKGDGNCLFNALSDQIYGNQNQHLEIRARVIAYMREHADYYKMFIDTAGGAAQRRNPKRKTAKAYSSAQVVEVTPEELDRVFESHLQQMAKGGTYGDNMEISAFANAYGLDVKIYQRDFAYVVSPNFGEEDREREMVHIAYHTWEHYSSIRNINGPHSGMPKVFPKLQPGHSDRSQAELLAKTPYTQPWMEDVVLSSLPHVVDLDLVRRTLEECKGSIDNAVSKLLDAEDRASVSSATDSSSSKRQWEESDEERQPLSRKRRDRRQSSATKVASRGARKEAIRLASLADEAKSEDSEYDLPMAIPIDSTITFMPTGDPTSPTKMSLLQPDYISFSPSSQPSITSSDPPTSSPPSEAFQRINDIANPQKPRETARVRKEKKKLAQKAAARERKLLAAAVANANSKSKNPKWNPDGKVKIGSSPAQSDNGRMGIGIEQGIKTLYI